MQTFQKKIKIFIIPVVLIIYSVLFINTSLYANNFNRFYHCNYGCIDRTVLVFDSKPEYKVVEYPGYIKIEVWECAPSSEIQDVQINESVVRSYKLKTDGSKTIFLIYPSGKYFVKYFGFEESVYKLVLDIFNVEEPITSEDCFSFSDFYKTIGKPEQALLYLKKAEKIQKHEKIEKELQTLVESAKQEGEIVEKKLLELEKKDKPLFFFFVIIVVVAIIGFSVLIIQTISKKSKLVLDESKSDYKEGFENEEFKKKLRDAFLTDGTSRASDYVDIFAESHLLDCFMDLIAFTLFLTKTISQSQIEYEKVKSKYSELISESKAISEEKGFSEKHWEKAFFAICAWIDEKVLCSVWDKKSLWQMTLLQREHFNTSNAGEVFYSRLENLNNDDISIREVYTFCLILGFKGKYFQVKDKIELEKIIKMNLEIITGLPETEYPDKLFKSAYIEESDKKKKKKSIISPLTLILITFPVLLFFILFSIFSNILNEMMASNFGVLF